MGILELLTIIFIVLKVAEVIDWSWWLVFAPMYVYVAAFAVWVAFTVFVGVLAGIGKAMDIRKKK